MTDNLHIFAKKVWIAGGIFAFIAVFLLLFQATFNVLLLVLAGVLIALFFRGLSDWLHRKTGWNLKICLIASIGGTILLLSLLMWLMANKIQSQFTELTQTLPATIEHAKQKLNESSIGQKIVDKLTSAQAQKNGQSILKNFFKSTFGLFADIYVVLFLGIFFTASPKIYVRGIVNLVPVAGRDKAVSIITQIGTNLKKWLKGKLFAMFVVFVLTAVGLLIVGTPMWLVLAIIAGILNFIPNFGPLIALIPAVLVALLQSPSAALIVAFLYVFIQVVESNFITPLIQQKLISIPPALIIIMQLLIAPLTGAWGLIVATPILVIIIVLVQSLYPRKKSEKP